MRANGIPAFGQLRMFKRVRVESMVQALMFWNKSGDHRLHPSSISLATTLVYMLNSVVSRPVDKPAENALHECITTGCWDEITISEEDNQTNMRPRRYRYGLLFPADIRGWSEQIQCPHLGPGLNMPETIYPKLFGGKTTLITIQGTLLSAMEVEQPTSALQDRMNRRITIKGPRAPVPHVGPIDEEDIIDLDPQEVQFIPVIQNSNANIGAAVTNMNARVSQILARFYMDILLRAPNQSNQSVGHPYCRLDIARCKVATAANFQEKNLAKVWYKVIAKPSTRDIWDRNFDHLFPSKAQIVEEDQRKAGGTTVKKQGYNQCAYYTDWCATIRTLEVASTETLRAAVKVSPLK